MSVRVNLLPEATKQQGRSNQQRLIALAGFAALLLALGGAYLWQSNSLSNAEADLAAAENSLALAQSEEADLAPFADIDRRVAEAEAQLSAALAAEVSIAGILQDIAAVTPSDTGLTNMNLVLEQPNPDAPPQLTVGSLNLAGQVTTGIAPGVERILLAFDKVGTFDEPFFNSTTVDEDGVATFSVDVGLLPSARTDRYTDGLPEEFRR